jgi:hypothetical protein
MDMDPYTIFFLLVIGAYLLLYISGRYYLRESYEDKPVSFKRETRTCPGTIYEFEEPADKPYVTRPIDDVDDYEYNLVFHNEGDREMSKAVINKLTAQYPLDWSGLPPSAMRFQEGFKQQQEAYANAPPVPEGANPFKEIDGSSLTPPDTSAIEMEERKILSTYVSKPPVPPAEYNIEDAKELIDKIYEKKNLIPQVKVRDNNVYEIIGTRRKDEKIVYEGEDAQEESEAPVVGTEAVKVAMEDQITIPQRASDIAAGLDPYYTPNTSTRTGRWDYMRWTPGLERMFAPTYPTQDWIGATNTN